MAKSKIVLTINSAPVLGDRITFSDSLVGFDITENFANARTGPNQSRISDLGNSQNAFELYSALYLDYYSSGLYTFSIYENTVTMTAVLSNVVFSMLDILGASVSYVITNETELASIEFSEINNTEYVLDTCNYVNLNILTNIPAGEIIINNVSYLNPVNPLSIQAARGATYTIEAIDGFSNSVFSQFKTPDFLSIQPSYIVKNNTPNGVDIVINIEDKYGINLSYSLNNLDWTIQNYFNSLPVGNYTIYVKDQFNCLVEQSLTIDEMVPVINTVNPFSYISPAMSIRYKKLEAWDNIDIYKNDSNTLSCEELANQSYQYIQKFKGVDFVKTQLLSNYENIIVNVVKEDGSKDVVALENKINFLNIRDKRDAFVYSISSDKTGIYFTAGNTYSYDTVVANGTFVLNGKLPEYGMVGNYINLNGIGWFIIEDIIYNESANADVLIINYNNLGNSSVEIIGSEYNKKNFNVYEFLIDFSSYLNQQIRIEILQSGTGFENCNYLSELLEVNENYDDCVELIWYGIKDTMIFYSTGIRNIGNYEFLSFNASNDSSVEVHKTTSSSILISSSNYELKTLEIDGLSTGIMLQLIQASLHAQLFINKENYVSASEPEVEVQGLTNMHLVKLNLIKKSKIRNFEYN